MEPKPWETAAKFKKRAADFRHATEKAKRGFSKAVSADVRGRLDQDSAKALAREYVKHGDLRHALISTGFANEDMSGAQMSKLITKVRSSQHFARAFDAVVTTFSEHEILTRDRVLAGLFVEASDRYGPTSGASRVSAWAKLAQLTGLEAEAKRGEDLNKELQAPGGVLMVPFVQSIEQWEQAAVKQQAQLKADVRN